MSDDLARKLAACPLFRWRPGMLATNGWRVVEHNGQLGIYHPDAIPGSGMGGVRSWINLIEGPDPWGYGWRWFTSSRHEFAEVPDLADHGNAGHLLALVRQRITSLDVELSPHCGARLNYTVEPLSKGGPGTPVRFAHGPTLGHACAAALIALGGERE